MIFNIYYINFPKVYEIKMMLSNVVSLSKEITKDNILEGDASLKAKFGLNFMDLFKLGDIESGGNIKGSKSNKVLETFEIKTTKSVILDDVVKNSNTIISFEKIEEGELIKLDNIKLSLENEAELRMVKFMNSGAFKDLIAPGNNGMDMNNIFNSMFKDYAYKIKGENENLDNKILFKIPLTFESEFESSYSVDDLFVGRVSIVGLYKGKIKVDDLKNSFEYFQEIGQLQNSFNANKEDEEIQDSHYSQNVSSTPFDFKSSGDGNDYHYIDLLAIVQNVNISSKKM
ncbi:hypothetical protein HNP37_001930 [Flavobacterium nitrogenifigens]|uniref:Uncharacterized protein n=2 Tax=Flavobacterium TaxID=237 RepID=A0A7W7IWH6_9FLAO|nr:MULTISPECIES: hypothetical protein [Flavobacterium]MBB4801869.1 hypothetical protein [Flavobacterium nitrogenifigens]MBB6386827.1 hypothetical protein [Flavobacterium notoginsengisoli]